MAENRKRNNLARVFVFKKTELTVDGLERLNKNINDPLIQGGSTNFDEVVLVSTYDKEFATFIANQNYGPCVELSAQFGVDVSRLYTIG